MNNIFENAYFGKAYKTRDGRKAIILQKTFEFDGITQRGFIVATNDKSTYTSYPIDLEGKIQCWSHQRPEDLCDGSDIVSEWQEEITDEELNEFVDAYEDSLYATLNSGEFSWYDIDEAFKAGFRARGSYYSKKNDKQ